MPDETFTFRVDARLKSRFTTAAKAKDRSGAQLLRDFMRDFVRSQKERSDHDVWFRRQVQAGLDAANAGDVVSADEVEAEAAAWRHQIRDGQIRDGQIRDGQIGRKQTGARQIRGKRRRP